MLVEEMRLQNIIDHISVYDASNVDNEDVREKIFFLLRGRNPDGKNDLSWDGVERVVSDISSAKAYLLEIEPVCGANVLLVAKYISLERT